MSALNYRYGSCRGLLYYIEFVLFTNKDCGMTQSDIKTIEVLREKVYNLRKE